MARYKGSDFYFIILDRAILRGQHGNSPLNLAYRSCNIYFQHFMTNPYDETPYLSYAISDSHPDRLATMATIFGMQPTNIQHCSVLELGCASGGNIMPMAEQLPHSTFTGIDYSQVQIDQGQDRIDELGLSNISLARMDIMNLDDDFGTFDYIIAHGLYSWVPRHVQDKVMEVCARHLNPQGVAYVCYNAYPAWHIIDVVRDIMRYGAKNFTSPQDRVKHAKQALSLVTNTVSVDSPYGQMLLKLQDIVQAREDFYLLHEFLGEENNPVYFHEFVDHANQHNLQFLCELSSPEIEPGDLSPKNRALLEDKASSFVEIEQYMDFIGYRNFRKSLLCHDSNKLDRDNLSNQVVKLHVRFEAKPEIVNVTFSSAIIFKTPIGNINAKNPLMNSILTELAEAWPATLPVSELIATNESDTHPDRTSATDRYTSDDTQGTLKLLYDFHLSKHIKLSTQPSLYATHSPNKPTATKLNRLQAKNGEPVSSLRHKKVPLNAFQIFVLQMLDGETDHAMIYAVLIKHVRNGHLTLRNDETGMEITELDEIETTLSNMITSALDYFTRSALLR